MTAGSYTHLDTPLGRLLLTADPDGTLTSLHCARDVPAGLREDPEPFAEAREQLDAYFAGELRAFRLPSRAPGTEFRRRVWAALDEVPYGTTLTYGELAASIGAPRAAVRAVGGALGANPLLIVRPCHRVIGADGCLTGYAGGLDRKIHLLTLEGALDG
ncbi:methylated-DNA--[protein]-cysteine S-methyltransferase [Streptomyces malaysiense]|uniref:Methylated-DNA--protein-cysteine methyltransferase n=1 Tax=Streptomyces malaysiense TaxID=1428626 RepID=A0A1J4PQQ0_9ACTN|nr:methylated-DNA--[protein]-cysteine S-methyltransferase [Streptomyces malaysiense]OIK23058.1 cysteine methyltransferase [Streptomyces malaysiense]